MINREIKFRVWDKLVKCWMSEDMIALTGENVLIDVFGINKGLNEQYKNGEIIVSQFTGLQDKNGRDIYEGDVIKYPDVVSEIFFRDGAFCCYIDKNNTRKSYLELGQNSFRYDFEIIGNIFENPELVENK